MEENKNVSNKLLPGIIVGLVVGIGATVGCFSFDYLKENKKEVTEPNTEYKNTKEYKEDNIIESFKEYYTSQGFVMVNNVKTWDVTIKEEKDDYVIFESTYTCNDNSGSCIYVSQEVEEDGKYILKAKANGKYENYKFVITSIEPASITIKEPEVVEPTLNVTETTELDYETYSVLLEEYLTRKGLIFKPNLSMFRPDEFKYLGYYESKPNEKWYEVHGHYACLDEGPDCVYQEQVDDKDNGAYTFTLHIVVSEGKIVEVTKIITTEGLIK